ncbi:MAG: hypothetical protein AAF919_04240 [Pseudomonadota bacterium]
MRRVLCLVPLAVAACQPVPGAVDVPPGEVRVVSATANAQRAVIRLSDGARCVSDRPADAQAGWSGVTAECGYELPFTVTYRRGGERPQRFKLEESFGAVDAEGNPVARSEIFVTDTDGVRRLFVAPLGRSVRFETAEAAG